jgi:hypothetical protein
LLVGLDHLPEYLTLGHTGALAEIEGVVGEVARSISKTWPFVTAPLSFEISS